MYSRRVVAGFSLIEMLVYISVLIVVSSGSLTLLFSLSDRMMEQKAAQLVTREAEAALERMLTDIKNGVSYNAFYSTLETSPGELSIESGSTTTRFVLSGGALTVDVNGTGAVPLTSGNVALDELRFFAYDNAHTQMARIVMTLSASVGDATVTKTFSAGAVLRGSYE